MLVSLLVSLVPCAPRLAQDATVDGTPAAHGERAALVPEITRAEIEQHVRFLASDQLLGRPTGSKESETAARYLADVLARYGIEPAGDDKSFLQRVPFSRGEIEGTPELELGTKDGSQPECVWQRDWRYSGPALAKRSFTVKVAHKAEEIPREGLEGVALFLDEPARRTQREWLSASGHARGKGIGLVLVPMSEEGAQRSPGPLVEVGGNLLHAVRAGLLESLGLEVRMRELPAYNVVGLLRGEGPSAARAVVLSAHYDHLAQDNNATEPGADRIFNGADDDASGCAIVLELAGALAARKPRAHSVVFLLATGEEIGLVGTRYYLEHPAVALAETLANLNFEMLGRPDPLVEGAGHMWLTGWDQTNLGEAFAKAGLPVAVDPRPKEHFYERSDNYAFVTRGVIGQTFSTYNLHTDYHHVSDEADKIDFEHMTQCARASAEAVTLVVDGRVVPAWSAAAHEKQKPREKPAAK